MQDCHLFPFITHASPTIQLLYCWFIIGVAFSNSLTDSDLQLLIETEQDQTRQSFFQYYLKYLYHFICITSLLACLIWPKDRNFLTLVEFCASDHII